MQISIVPIYILDELKNIKSRKFSLNQDYSILSRQESNARDAFNGVINTTRENHNREDQSKTSSEKLSIEIGVNNEKEDIVENNQNEEPKQQCLLLTQAYEITNPAIQINHHKVSDNDIEKETIDDDKNTEDSDGVHQEDNLKEKKANQYFKINTQFR